MNAWKYEVMESHEHASVVNDIIIWDMNVKQVLIVIKINVYVCPQVDIDNEMVCNTREGANSNVKGEPHLVTVRTIQVARGGGGTLT